MEPSWFTITGCPVIVRRMHLCGDCIWLTCCISPTGPAPMHIGRPNTAGIRGPVPLPRNVKQRMSDDEPLVRKAPQAESPVVSDASSQAGTSAVVSAASFGWRRQISPVSAFRHAECHAGYRAVVFGRDSVVPIIACVPVINPLLGFSCL